MNNVIWPVKTYLKVNSQRKFKNKFITVPADGFIIGYGDDQVLVLGIYVLKSVNWAKLSGEHFV